MFQRRSFLSIALLFVFLGDRANGMGNDPRSANERKMLIENGFCVMGEFTPCNVRCGGGFQYSKFECIGEMCDCSKVKFKRACNWTPCKEYIASLSEEEASEDS
ncbi:unnamed protein product [Caenorhabditis auriculariae]|uniref:Uncharacterized protein n=1 Tax=Caenorhabditis auriculariae TaxID=2777116 RepID=A0A8S1HUX5_9PELO|nr:unnamed protein product [Caenorhabditis auriculariae]